MKLRFSISILLMLCSYLLSAQKTLEFDALSMEDGFASSKANTIIQDSKGFIWIGTWNGLNRYDGYSYELFKPNFHDSTTISNGEITALLEDHLGNIWIGTSNGLNKLDPITGKITIYEFSNRILTLYEDKDNMIWVGTWVDGLYRLNPTTNEKKHVLQGYVVCDVIEDDFDELWVATYNGLMNLNRSSLSYSVFIPEEGRATMTSLAKTKDGTVWVGNWGGGVSKLLNHENKDSIRFVNYNSRINPNNGLVSNNVYELHGDMYGNLWIGTWDKGMALLDKTQTELDPFEAVFYTYQHDYRNPFGLSGNNVTALLVDKSGVLWVGSSKIDRAHILNSGMASYYTAEGGGENFSKNGVTSFAGNDAGDLWLGTVKKVIQYQFDEKNNEYVVEKDLKNLDYSFKGFDYVSNSVLSLLKTDDGLWVGTDDAGLLFYKENSSGKLTSRSSFYNMFTDVPIPGNKVGNLVASKKYPNVFWLGTLQRGFAKCTYVNGKLEVESYRAQRNDNSLTDNNIRDILEDKDGYLWIATQYGLNRFDPVTKRFDQFFYAHNDSNTINDNIINDLYEDSSGDLWIGTNAGLNKKIELNKNGVITIKFKGYPKINYLSSDLITNILEDDKRNLWLCFYSEMIQFNTTSELVVKEFSSKGYKRIGIGRNVAYKDCNGQLLIGGILGFLCFHPENLNTNVISPRVSFTELEVHNKKIESGQVVNGQLVLKNALPFAKEIELSYKDNTFTVFFSAMDFKEPGENRYSYFLDGYDDKWNEVGNRNSAIYTGVSPGEYLLKVNAANSDGKWSVEPAVLKIIIVPPFWQTVYAYILYGLVFIALLYFFNKYSVIQIKEKSRLQLEHVEVEKEHELNELKSHFFTNITHEFRTPLTLILGPVEELLSRSNLDKEVGSQISLIQRNAIRLLRLVNQLMEFRKVEKGKTQLLVQEVNLVIVVVDLYESFKKMADSKNINFVLNCDQKSIIAWLDLDKFEKALFNLLSNAFKFTEDGGKISILVELCKSEEGFDCFAIEIEDTGIGIPADKIDYVFERFYQVNQKKDQSTGGIGLYLTKAFVDLHKGNIIVESELGEGSCFRMEVPLDVREQIDTNEVQMVSQRTTEPLMEIEEQETEVVREEDSKLPLLLLVEDDNDMNQFIANGLSDEFNIISCFNGEEALELAEKQTPDLIITDIMMPVMDGYELFESLKKDINTSHIPLVFLTAKTSQEDEIAGLKMGAVDYIFKPFNMLSLKLKIKNLLKSRSDLHSKIKKSIILNPEEIELSSLDEVFLKKAVAAVDNNLDDASFDVEKLSEELGMSSNQAYRKIKALTGQTAKEFIRSQRLKTSANLLLQKKRSISEIIYMVGFSSPSYFTRCFKEYFGCTPSEYIDRHS